MGSVELSLPAPPPPAKYTLSSDAIYSPIELSVGKLKCVLKSISPILAKPSPPIPPYGSLPFPPTEPAPPPPPPAPCPPEIT